MFERRRSAGKIVQLPVEDIHPSPYQARTTFDEQELAGLAQSIRENGLLQPITVRKTDSGYELVAGERRLRACKLAKMGTIPSIVCNFTDPRTAAHELYGFKMALHQIGFLPESEVITDPDTFGAGRLDGPMPRNPEELLAFVCDERCKNRAGHTQEELDAICAKCPLGQLYEDAEAQDLRIRERSERALREHIEGVRHAEDTVTALLGGHEALAYLAALRDGQILQENECEHYAAQIAEAGAAWETVLEGVSFEDLSRLRHLLREVDEHIKDGGELFNGFQHETGRNLVCRLLLEKKKGCVHHMEDVAGRQVLNVAHTLTRLPARPIILPFRRNASGSWLINQSTLTRRLTRYPLQ